MMTVYLSRYRFDRFLRVNLVIRFKLDGYYTPVLAERMGSNLGEPKHVVLATCSFILHLKALGGLFCLFSNVSIKIWHMNFTI